MSTSMLRDIVINRTNDFDAICKLCKPAFCQIHLEFLSDSCALRLCMRSRLFHMRVHMGHVFGLRSGAHIRQSQSYRPTPPPASSLTATLTTREYEQ